jgi:hypothetical protein
MRMMRASMRRMSTTMKRTRRTTSPLHRGRWCRENIRIETTTTLSTTAKYCEGLAQTARVTGLRKR